MTSSFRFFVQISSLNLLYKPARKSLLLPFSDEDKQMLSGSLQEWKGC